jgi:hypothetical protein
MSEKKITFNYRRALVTFLASYIVVEVVCAAVSVLITILLHDNSTTANVHDHAFVDVERFYPLINLIIWVFFARVYFKHRSGELSLAVEALKLGLLWVVAAPIFDIIFFILIKNPYSLSFHDFYVGQAPWIYIIYFAVFIGPLFYTFLFEHSRSRQNANVKA